MPTKKKKSILNAILPSERKALALMLVIDAILLFFISYSYLFVKSDYITIEANITYIEHIEGSRGRGDRGAPAQIRFKTDNGMQFDYLIRGKNRNDIAYETCERIKILSKEHKAVITYVERENLISLSTLFPSLDYYNTASLEINGETFADRVEFASYNIQSFWGFCAILLFFTGIFAAHPVYCVVSAIIKRKKRRKSKERNKKESD